MRFGYARHKRRSRLGVPKFLGKLNPNDHFEDTRQYGTSGKFMAITESYFDITVELDNNSPF